jgi:anti-sigma B factor antagonist
VVPSKEAGMSAAPFSPEASARSGQDTISAFFRLSVDHRNASVIVGGELDDRHTHLLLDGLRTLEMTPHRAWTIDLTDVTFCDSGGLAALVEGHGIAREHQRDLTVVGASECVTRQLTMAGLEPLLCTGPLPPGGGLPARRPLPRQAHSSRGPGIPRVAPAPPG